MAPLLFLDIDGVLNSVSWQARRETKAAAVIVPDAAAVIVPDNAYWLRSIDPDAVARLNRLLNETGAGVIISSTWREMLTLPELRGVLGQRGFTGTIVGRTPTLDTHRWSEILACLAGHDPLPPFVALDDDPLHHYGCDQPRRFVRTDYRVGLQDAQVDRCIQFLREQTAFRKRE